MEKFDMKMGWNFDHRFKEKG